MRSDIFNEIKTFFFNELAGVSFFKLQEFQVFFLQHEILLAVMLDMRLLSGNPIIASNNRG